MTDTATAADAAWWRPWQWFPDRWAEIDQARGLGDRTLGQFERELFVVAAVVLVLQRFPASGDHLARLVGEDSQWFALADRLQWALGSGLAYALLPILHLRRRGRSIREGLHLGVAGTRQHLGVYLGLFLLMLVPIALVAMSPDFERIYPFYKTAGRSWVDLLAWEGAYAVQFIGLEIFFRGYLLDGLRRPFGSGAIFVMAVPYVMLHFGKTGIESLAALVAGLVLGTLAMRWRSIWGGAILHILVAWTMDLTQLIRTDNFPPPTLHP